MHISLASRSSVRPPAGPGGLGRSARQREWDNDQAAWEARLRKIAGRVPDEEKPVRPISLAPTILEPAGRVTCLDALLLPRTLPAFVGTERNDLACFGCSGLIGQAITARAARRQHPEGDGLVVRCPCGAVNLLAKNRDGRGR